MADTRIETVVLTLRHAGARLLLYAHALALRATGSARVEQEPGWLKLLRTLNTPALRKWAVGLGAVAAVGTIGCAGLWWRLSSGPLAVDMMTPWLTAALEERFGGRHHIQIGGTQLERDEDGRTALRLRDIVVRDAEGTVVATAPKAEVGIAGGSLLTGHVRPQRLSLIGAEMAIRILRDGQLVVFAGSEKRPFATASAEIPAPLRDPSSIPVSDAIATRAAETAIINEPNLFAAVLGWLQDLDAVGLDGRELTEVGLRSGSIAIDDQRTGKQLSFGNINLSLTRPKEGGAALAVSSIGTDGPWSLNATISPRGEGRRAIEAVVRDVSPKDLLLALRIGTGDLQTDVPISAAIRAEVDRDGVPQAIEGRIIVGAGYIGALGDPDSRILIDEAQVELRWDAINRQLWLPMDIQAGPNRVMLMSQIEPPRSPRGAWSISVSQGRILLASLERSREPPLVLDRVNLRAAFDSSRRRFDLEQADLRGASGGVALSGTLDFSGAEPRVMLGLAGTRMAASAFKRLWPAFIAPDVKSWVEQRIQSGVVERMDIAVNAPLPTLVPSGPPIPDDGLSVDIVASGASVLPVDNLPIIREANIVARILGRRATVSFDRGVAELPSGRKLNISNGVFEVPDTAPKQAPTRTRFRIEGGVEAAAELLAMERLRDAAAVPFDASTARGSLSAQVMLGLPLKNEITAGSLTYALDAELTGFTADRFIRGLKAEAGTLRISANQQAMQIKGDMKIAGTPATVEFRKAQSDSEADVRIQTTLDDAARTRMGFDTGNALTGSIPVKLSGRVKVAERESRLAVEADLTQAKITEMLPGWIKSAGRPGRMTFTLLDKGQSMRLDDFVLESAGVSLRGGLEIDSSGEILHVHFPTFALSDGDKASLKADRASDGTLKVSLRGDVYDGRGFLKTAVAGQKPEQRVRRSANDLDVEIKVGALTGHHGEALRGLDLRLSRRAGQIRSFALTGKLGHDAAITGDLRTRGGARQVVYLETNDAGALFRLTDIYPRIIGGVLSIAMDPPTADSAPQEGLLNIRDFAVRGEPVLERVASSGSNAYNNDRAGVQAAVPDGGVAFSRMRVEFTRSPGRFAIRDGVVWGPAVGATVDGYLDYFREEVRLKGTFVPAYALNNMFGRLPIVGLFLGGGSNEGLLGVTYQVVGSPQAPMLQVNPMSAVAPGFLRKLFEFRGANDQTDRPPASFR